MNNVKRVTEGIAALLLVITWRPAQAQPEPLALARFESAPVVDGVLDEAVWSNATAITDFVETWPGDNTPPRRRTRVLLGTDATHLYVGIEAEDEPGAVRATLARRDDVLGDDHVRLLLDTFDDRRRAYVVVVNPFGIVQDGIWVEGREVDYSFDLLFESKGQLGAHGYVVELSLPFSSLRAGSGPARAWGLHIFRKIRHIDDTEVSWRPLERGRARLLEQEGRIGGFVDAAPPRRLEIIPTLTLSREDGPSASAGEQTDPEAQLGGTLRWALGQAMVVDAAIRPDFAQVEADQPVVTANQRFPLFFPEKRPFFLEGTEIFQTPLAVLNTRTILDPEIAVKATGKRGSTTAGVLVARDEGPARAIADSGGSADAADLAVVRVQRELGDRAELGVLATGFHFFEREGAVLGLDGRMTVDERSTWSAQLVATTAHRAFYDPDLDRNVLRRGDGAGYSIVGKRTARRNTVTLAGDGRSPDYIADLGFTRQVDLHRWSLTARHDAEPRSTGALRSWSTEGVALVQTDWSGHSTYAYLYPQLHLQFSRQTHLSLFAYADFLEIREHEFGPRRAAGRPGAFFGEPSQRTIYHGASLSAETAPSERIAVALSLDRSWNGLDFDFGGGPRYPRGSPAALADPNAALDPGTADGQFVSLTVDWRPTDALRLGVDLSRSTLVRDDTGRVAYDQRLLTVRITYQLHRSVFARLRGNYDSLAGTSLTEVLAAWTPSPGTSVYLGYEEPAARDPRRFQPGDAFAGWRSASRTAFLKISYRLGLEWASRRESSAATRPMS